ncbi:unnamed protein product [Adineta steineri]|uniref:Uncharacterized protein n=1 Tax=Adineta steineri TaxID=433720 RepID=A0A814WEF5_9BILA|nr:unnamed protein product [Adineta steineri]CAF1201148.1 unnamed protein product [Adineta steineri]
MSKQIFYLLFLLIIITQVSTFFKNTKEVPPPPSSDVNEKGVWKSKDVFTCVRRLRSIIIKPSKYDLSQQMMECLKNPKKFKLTQKT